MYNELESKLNRQKRMNGDVLGRMAYSNLDHQVHPNATFDLKANNIHWSCK